MNTPASTPLTIPDRYQVSKVEPGTPHPDEPTEMIPPGWYVLGGDFAEADCWDIVIRIEEAYDPDGNDITAQVAELVTTLLSAATVDRQEAR